jgi:AcrR family transcriptional regulator
MEAMSEVNKYGQALGRKGAESRKRLLDSAKALLTRDPTAKLTPSGIAREAKLASQTFYLYFETVNEALLQLSEEAGEDMSSVLKELNGPWEPDSLYLHCQQFVTAFARYWNRHREILNFRNFQADNGDIDFMRIRLCAAMPVINAIAARIRTAQGVNILSEKDALARSVIIFSAIERLAARSTFKAYSPQLLESKDLLRAETDILTLLFTPPPQQRPAQPARSSSTPSLGKPQTQKRAPQRFADPSFLNKTKAE